MFFIIRDALKETFFHREASGEIHVRLLLAMPDHLHALMSFRGKKPMKKSISDIKSWLARKHGISWQRDFFDHRLRSWESAAGKGSCIRANPLRARLIGADQTWPYMLDRVR